MAAFSDVGAICAFASCGQQTFLPFKCAACSESFCELHIAYAAHECKAAAAETQEKQVEVCPSCDVATVRRCVAKGCREVLQAHNTVHCWRCRQDVCIRHRFEEDHPCIPIDVAVSQALAKAQTDMGRDGYIEAHSTLVKVFGNILKDPNNEKFRSLKKDNAVVKQKLRHPACLQALVAAGFQDTGDVYVCRSAADLSIMRQMHASLQKHPPDAPPASSARLVNGVIVRQSPPQPTVASSSTKSSNGYSAPEPAVSKSASPAVSKPKSAFDFESKSKREQAEKLHADKLQEARSLQKQRYKAGLTTDDPQVQPKAKATPVANVSRPNTAQSQQQQQQSGADCALQ